MAEKNRFSAPDVGALMRQAVSRLLKGPDVKHLLPLYAAGAVLALLLPLVLNLETSMSRFCCFIAFSLAMIGFALSVIQETE